MTEKITPERLTVQAVATLKAAFPRQEIGAATIRVYAKCLADVPPEKLVRAVQRLIATSKFFPTIAEIRAEVVREDSDAKPTPEEAWGEVVGELRRVGPSKPPVFSCEEVSLAVRAVGGWDFLCLQARNPADRARFVSAYREISDRSTRSAQLGPALRGSLPAPAAVLVKRLANGLSTAIQGQGATIPKIGDGSSRSATEGATGPEVAEPDPAPDALGSEP